VYMHLSCVNAASTSCTAYFRGPYLALSGYLITYKGQGI
jgi:hypothetical protein